MGIASSTTGSGGTGVDGSKTTDFGIDVDAILVTTPGKTVSCCGATPIRFSTTLAPR